MGLIRKTDRGNNLEKGIEEKVKYLLLVLAGFTVNWAQQPQLFNWVIIFLVKYAKEKEEVQAEVGRPINIDWLVGRKERKKQGKARCY